MWSGPCVWACTCWLLAVWGKFRNLWDHGLLADRWASRLLPPSVSTKAISFLISKVWTSHAASPLRHGQTMDRAVPWPCHLFCDGVHHLITLGQDTSLFSYIALAKCFGIAIRGFLIIVKICLKCWETRSYHITVSFVLELLPCCDQQYDGVIVAQDLFLEYMVFCLTGEL